MHSFIKQTALSLGFDACGIAKADALVEDAQFLRSWLDQGMHGEMSYLDRNFEKRTDPRELVPGCKSVVVVLLNYFPKELQSADAPKIGKYAYSEIDYHLVLKEKLNQLEQHIRGQFGDECISSNYQHLFVDSAPVLERRWAERAGLGWIGKHKQLIHPGLGSYVFIGILMLNSEMEYDRPISPKCGGCTKCLDACPTKALNNGLLDARRCISYLTIESKREIPAEFHNLLSGNALGCDICADVCPWNKKWARPHLHPELLPLPDLLKWGSGEWHSLDKDGYNKIFKRSAVKRAGYEKLMANLQIIRLQNEEDCDS
jgi:epoxyqueuosine reductase